MTELIYLIILIEFFFLNFISLFPFDYKPYETLEQKRPDLCKCQDLKPFKGRIYGGKIVDPKDLTFIGTIYTKILMKPVGLKSEKEFCNLDFIYSSEGTVSLLNEEW